jgi:hypothetical protein
MYLVDEFQSFLSHVDEDDRICERHPLCIQCITEFEKRIADSR